MLDKIAQAAHAVIPDPEWRDALARGATFLFIGALFGLGQLLNSKEKLSVRIVVGRCLSTAGLAMAAGVVLLIVPGLPLIAQMGVAAALASLGTSGLERLVQRALGGRGEN